jgi:geranylgeranyl reductase family protein
MAVAAPSAEMPVLIVGAGPAGATAARTLALAGVPVRLLDRSAFPRNKPCGGGISLRVVRRFPFLADVLGRIATHRLSRLHLEGPDGQSTTIESDEPAALMIRRTEFDELLLSLALDAGADLVSGADIVQASDTGDRIELVARDGRRFAAPIVIAADGVHSVVARRLGLNRGWPAEAVALDMMEETPRSALRDVDPSTLWVAYGYEPKDGRSSKFEVRSTSSRKTAEGYAYIFPKRDHVNIGIGYVLSYYRSDVDRAPYDMHRAFIAELKSRGIVTGESVRPNFTPFHIPVGGPLRQPASNRVLLAGDAGGFVNAFTAEGIYYAMVSGELAAQAVVDSARHPGTLARRYTRACDREIGRELRESVLIQKYLFADRTRMSNIIRNARRHPRTTRAILDYATGRRSYASVRFHLLTRFPGLALQMLWGQTRARYAQGWLVTSIVR